MVAITVITAATHKESARQTILKRLREADATSAAMPVSVDVDGEDMQAALGELLAAGKVREARGGLYYLDDSQAKAARPGLPFVALLAILIAASFTASLIALAASAG